MKTFTYNYELEYIDSNAFNMYFMNMKPCVFDIETTGLSPANSGVVMTALMIPGDNAWTVTQFLAEDYYDEHRVLTATMDMLRKSGVDYIITYNGARFDVPFVNRRLEQSIMPDKLSIYNLDLYSFVRKETILSKKLSSLSQKSVEQYLGIAKDRDDVISGADNARLFNEYAISGNERVERIILTHNREDVFQLYRILQELSVDNFSGYVNSSDFHQAVSDYGFPVMQGRFNTKIDFKPRAQQLRVFGSQVNDPIDALYFSGIDRCYSAEFKSNTEFFEIVIPLELHGDSVYVNLKALGLEGRFRELENCVNNYLILSDEKQIYYSSVNALGEAIIKNLIDYIA